MSKVFVIENTQPSKQNLELYYLWALFLPASSINQESSIQNLTYMTNPFEENSHILCKISKNI